MSLVSKLTKPVIDKIREVRVMRRCPPRVRFAYAGRELSMLTDTWSTANFCDGRLVDGDTLNYEPAESTVLKALFPFSKVFFDVGANIGYYSMLAAACDTQVVAFEVIDTFADELERHLAHNNLSAAVTVVRAAVSDGRGTATYENFIGGATRASTSLDQFCEKRELWPDLVKMDIEGFELRAFRGADKLFSKQRPRMMLGLHPVFLQERGDHARDVLAFLLERDYRLHLIVDVDLQGKALLVPFDTADFPFASNVGLLCLPHAIEDIEGFDQHVITAKI